MLVGILILSGFTWTLYNDNQNQSKALEKKNAEIETLNQRIRELFLLEKLANLTKPAQPRGESSGTQMGKSYPMEFDYFYPDYNPIGTIITLYVPKNGSIASLDLFIDQFSSPIRYPVSLTLQKGDTWINQTWVKVRTYTIVDNRNETITSVVWQAPVIWSLNTTELGVYNTPQLSEGWYTLSMFGPVQRITSTWIPFGQTSTPHPIHALHDVAKIDSYRVIIVVTVLSDGVQGFFVASSDWFR
jgi:hypothetical protein